MNRSNGLWLRTGSRANIRLSLRFEKENPLSEESVWKVVPVIHDLATAESWGVKGVQNPAPPLAGAIGHGAGRRLNGRGGGPVPRPPWVAG